MPRDPGSRGGRDSMIVRLSLAGAALALIGAGAAEAPALWGHPSVNGGECCATLSEVRSHIDRIDRRIIDAMAERGQYVAEAGRFKKDPAAVSDPARVEAIILKARGLAQEAHLSPEVAEKTYRAMIAAFEDYE